MHHYCVKYLTAAVQDDFGGPIAGGLLAAPIRILVVDDFEPFRRFLTSTLQLRPEFHVICEVSDGLEAVQKADELQPDLILLDIGLPGLNGIEAGRQIGRVSPTSKILFVTQEASADLLKEVFNSGGCGYVVKTDARRELLTAVTTVLQGERFVGRRFGDIDFTDVEDAPMRVATGIC